MQTRSDANSMLGLALFKMGRGETEEAISTLEKSLHAFEDIAAQKGKRLQTTEVNASEFEHLPLWQLESSLIGTITSAISKSAKNHMGVYAKIQIALVLARVMREQYAANVI